MSRETLGLTDDVQQYLVQHSVKEHPAQRELRELTAEMTEAMMQISPEQGNFMQFMTSLIGAKRCIEVGVFTGYSALSVALVLPDEGMIHAFDVSKEWTDIGRNFWEKAGVSEKISLKLGPATEGLQALIDEGHEGSFDLAFIDADKVNYSNYYELCLKLMRPGGLILIDNVLWSGKVADLTEHNPDVDAIRALNALVADDSRVERCMLPLSDGVTMVRKL